MAAPQSDHQPGSAKPVVAVPLWLRLTVCVAVLGIVYSRVDTADLRALWPSIEPWRVLVTLSFYWLYHMVSAFRWFLLLSCVQPAVRGRLILRVFFESSFAGLFMLGNVGIELARIAGVTRANVSPVQAVIATALERLLGLAALAVAVCVGMMIAPQYVNLSVALTAGAACLAVTLLLGVAAAPPRHRLRTLLPERFMRRVYDRLAQLDRYAEAYRRRRATVALALFLSLLAQGIRIALVASAVAALGVAVPTSVLFVAVPIVTFAAMMPLSIGGLGVREAGYAYFLVKAGATVADAVALSLLLYVLLLISFVPGGVLLLRGRAERGVLSRTGTMRAAATAGVPGEPVWEGYDTGSHGTTHSTDTRDA